MTSTNTYTHSNHYLTLICNIALKTKYTRWYFNIISRALERPRNRTDAKALLGYVEGHHILPKSFELEGQKDKNNIAFLTPREHFIVHAILTKMFEGTYRYKMIHAFVIIKVGNQHNKCDRYFNSRLYDYHRKYFAERASNDREHLEKMWAASMAVIRGKKRSAEYCKMLSETRMGHVVTEETRKKLSLAHTGRKASEETRKKISLALKGKKRGPMSEEAKKKKSEIRKGQKQKPQALQKLRDYHKNKWINAPLLSCLYCQATYKSKTILTRYHNDNCKQKPLD